VPVGYIVVVVGVITLELQRLTFSNVHPFNSHCRTPNSIGPTNGLGIVRAVIIVTKSPGRDRHLQCGTFRGPRVFIPLTDAHWRKRAQALKT
jgi:hypothetical protein